MEQTPINCSEATISELKTAFYGRRPIAGIKFIATHYGPHNDELFSGYLLQRTPQGKYLFPGIQNAIFGPISPTNMRTKNLLGVEGFFIALQNGIFPIGIGGGPIDEHGDRLRRISCTALVVEHLDLFRDKYDRKVYGPLIRYVNFEDSNGDNLIQCLDRYKKKNDDTVTKEQDEKDEFELTKEQIYALRNLQTGSFAQNLKKGFEAANGDSKKHAEIFQMAFRFYEDEVAQARLFIDAEKAYEIAPKQIIDLSIPKTKDRFILLQLQSDASVINKVVHNKWTENRQKKLGVLFLHKKNGQFVLMPNMQHITSMQMKEVVKIIRRKIAVYRGIQMQISFSDLSRDEVLDMIPEIHFAESTGIISNGANVDPDVPGLIGKELSTDDVIEALQIGLDTDFFPPEFKKGCEKGICVRNRCWMHQYAQKRCFDVKDKEKVANSPIGSVLVKALERKSA